MSINDNDMRETLSQIPSSDIDMTNKDIHQSPDKHPEFVERKTFRNLPRRCVDGRVAENSEGGPQALGGSLLLMLIEAISKDEVFDQGFVSKQTRRLEELNIKPGVHRGSHRDTENGVCDCGFADKLALILKTAQDESDDITQRLHGLFTNNRTVFNGIDLPEIVRLSYEKLNAYSVDRYIKLEGEGLISTIESEGGRCEDVVHDHKEEVAYINMVKNTTLDTGSLNANGRQGFNLDMWAVLEDAEDLGIDTNLALGLSAILYVATEKVLVEKKGKPALPVVLITSDFNEGDKNLTKK